jgi:hypothetical protein
MKAHDITPIWLSVTCIANPFRYKLPYPSTPNMLQVYTPRHHDDKSQFLRTYCPGSREDLSAGEMILVADGDRELLRGSTLRGGIVR